jgi:hypothetical protein
MHREPVFARMCLVESLSAGPEALKVYRRMLDRFEEFFDDATKGEQRPSVPSNVTTATVLGICGLLYRYLDDGRSDELPSLLPDLVYIGEVPFIGPERAAEAAAVAAKLTTAG